MSVARSIFGPCVLLGEWPNARRSLYLVHMGVRVGATSVALVVSGSDLPLRGVGLTDRSMQRCADGAVSRFGTMSPVTVRATTLVFGPVKFDRVVKFVH